MEKIKLAIIDDELISRNMIKKLIQNNTRYEVAADFSDGKSAVDWLRYNEIDILLCDMQMPEMNGVDLLRIIHVIHEYLPVIVISGFDNFDYVRGSLVNGAANYLLKHELTEESLLQVLEQVREKYHIVPAEKAACRRTGYCIYDREEYTRDGIERMIREQKIQFGGGNYASLAISPDYRFSERINPEEFRRDVCSTIMDILAQILGTGEIPSALWKQMAFEKREQGAAEMPTLNEFFDFMEKERLPQKKVLEYSLEMMRLLCPGEMAECKKLTERVKGYEIFELLREDIMEFMNRERILEEKKKYRYSPLVNQVMEFVGKNYQEDISLEMCALELGVSYTHVSRAFKQETGMRFVEYLNRRRISRAKSLLIRGELSMKEVVENSGFRNYNYFFKVFKEITGMKPGEFAAKI